MNSQMNKWAFSTLPFSLLYYMLFEFQVPLMYNKSKAIICPVKVKVPQSCLTLRPHGLYSPWKCPGQNTGVGSLSLLQEIFPTQGSNPGLPHCKWILYQLSHQGSPRIVKWVAYPFPSGSSHSRNQTRVSCIAGRFFTNWAIREAYYIFILFL